MAMLRREEQIREMLDRQPSVSKMNDSEFVFGLKIRRGARQDQIEIRITLPPAFPNAKPSIRVVTGGVRHNWIDSNSGSIVGCSKLYSWNPNSRLADAVTDVINEFSRNPPMVEYSMMGGTQYSGPIPPPVNGYMSSFGTPGMNSTSSPNMYPAQGGPPSPSNRKSIQKEQTDTEETIFIPPAPDSFPEIEEMNLEELQNLQDNESEFKAFFSSMEMPKSTLEMKHQIILSNVHQAETNLGYKERLEKSRSQALELQKEAVACWEKLKSLESRQNDALRRFDPLRLLTELEASSNRLDEESEILAGEFLNEELSLQDFLKRQFELRKLYHLRRSKAERFRSQLKQ